MFASTDPGAYGVEYTRNGGTGRVAYEVREGSVRFAFTDRGGSPPTETYSR